MGLENRRTWFGLTHSSVFLMKRSWRSILLMPINRWIRELYHSRKLPIEKEVSLFSLRLPLPLSLFKFDSKSTFKPANANVFRYHFSPQLLCLFSPFSLITCRRCRLLFFHYTHTNIHSLSPSSPPNFLYKCAFEPLKEKEKGNLFFS